MLVLATVMTFRPVSAQPWPVIWQVYDVSLDVRADGTIHVTEDQIVQFNGNYNTGFADIPLDRVDQIDAITMSIEGTPLQHVEPTAYREQALTYTHRNTGGMLEIDYAFPPTSPGEAMHIVLQYNVRGAIRVNDQPVPSQEIWWTAISEQITQVGPVRAAAVSVTLPEMVPLEEIVASPPEPGIEGREYRWQRQDLEAGDRFEVRMQFPPITEASTPAWQDLATPVPIPATPPAR
jgi:hypothetical protein